LDIEQLLEVGAAQRAIASQINEKLTNISSIDLGAWNDPEDFTFDDSGNLYCGVHKRGKDFSKGTILKIYGNGKVEGFLKIDAWVTGIQFDSAGDLIALVKGIGLIRVDQNKT